MILKRNTIFIPIAIALLLHSVVCQEAKSYDKNDWIPISDPREEEVVIPKKASPRVLNVAEAPGANIFPEDAHFKRKPNQNYQQYLLETSEAAHQPKKVKIVEPYPFESIAPESINRQPTPSQIYKLPDTTVPINQRSPQQKQYVLQNVQSQLPIQYSGQQFLAPPQVINAQILQPTGQQFLFPDPYYQQALLSHSLLPPNNLNFFQPNQHQITLPPNATSYNPGIETINKGLAEKKSHKEKLTSFTQIDITTTSPRKEKENVQLLYVPLETLNKEQQTARQQKSRENQNEFNSKAQTLEQQATFQRTHLSAPKKEQIKNIEQDFIKQALEAHRLQAQFQNSPQALPLVSSTTYRPPTTKKRKPHQPPLAVYMGSERDVQISDVLTLLKHAKHIDVQDNIGPNSPPVFIGPSSLDAPNGFVKFDLPYLSSIDSNRVERKVDQLPFFVAPLSYKAPDGYSKIPLPSPHVGSVVVSNKEDSQLTSTTQSNLFDINLTTETVTHSSKKHHRTPQRHRQSSHKQRQRPQQKHEEIYEHVHPEHEVAQLQQANVYQPSPQEVAFKQPQQEYHQIKQENIYEQVQPQYEKPTQLSQPLYQQIYEQVQSTPTTTIRTTPKTNPLTQTINNYELEQINKYLPHSNVFTQPEREQIKYVDDHLEFELIPQSKAIQNSPEAAKLNEEIKKPKPTERNYFSTEIPFDFNSFNVLEEFQSKIENPQYTSSQEGGQPKQTYKSNFASPPKHYTFTSHDAVQVQPAAYSNFPHEIREQTGQNEDKTHNSNAQSLGTHRNEPAFHESLSEYRPSQQHIQDNNKFHEEIQKSKTIEKNQKTVQQNDDYENTHLPVLINNLQDHAIRPLLIPALIAPTTSGTNKVPPQSYTTPQTYISSTQSYTPVPKQSIPQTYTLSPQIFTSSPEEYKPVQYEPQKQFDAFKSTESIPLRQPQIYISSTPTANQFEISSPKSNPYQVDISSSIIPPTTSQHEISSTTPTAIEITTTTKRSRGRQRGGNRYSSTLTSTTSSPRRTAHHRTRRPTSRVKYNQETTESPALKLQRVQPETARRSQVPASRQRFRTRNRTVKPEVTTTEKTIVEQPKGEASYIQPQLDTPNINSFQYQSEQLIKIPKLLVPQTQNVPNHQLNQQEYIEPNLNIEISTPSSPQIPEQAVVINPTPETHYVQYAPIVQDRNVIQEVQQPKIETTRPSVRIRGRARTRGRHTTTSIPITTTTTTTEKIQQESEEEFYGFFRAPSFAKPSALPEPISLDNYERAPLYAATPSSTAGPIARSSNVVFDESINVGQSTPVHFIGEIRPKYQTTTVQYISETSPESTETTYTIRPSTTTTEIPKTRGKIRMRVPSRRKSVQPIQQTQTITSGEQYSTRQVTPQRIRNRGKSQFKSPERLVNKDEDVEGGNYPANFFKDQTSKPSSFQITVDPVSEEDGDDQLPYSSIIRPKILRKIPGEENQWTEVRVINDIPIKEKESIEKSTSEENSFEEATTSTEVVITDETPNAVSEEISVDEIIKYTSTEAANKPKSRRRGVWRRVKKPVDVFETAESQNYHTINANTFQNFEKPQNFATASSNKENIETSTQIPTTAKENSFFDTLYEMFGMAEIKETNQNTSQIVKKANAPIEFLTAIPPETTSVENVGQTSTEKPVFPAEYNEATTTPIVEESTTSQYEESNLSNQESTETTKITAQPWKHSTVAFLKTSTSTEITHETEICYKGRCVKSKEEIKPSS